MLILYSDQHDQLYLKALIMSDDKRPRRQLKTARAVRDDLLELFRYAQILAITFSLSYS